MVGISHSHSDIAMSKNSLQGEDITAIHHVVAGEGVTEDVGLLLWSVKAGSLIG